MKEESEHPCGRCGGPYLFDTTLPSVLWNRVVRPLNGPETLCLSCIVRIFAEAAESFTATLSGTGAYYVFNGLPIEVIINGENAQDAAALGEENNRLRCRLRELDPKAVDKFCRASTEEFNLKVLAFFACYDIHSDLWWTDVNDKSVRWLVNCNDEFAWGGADCEELTPENFGFLVQAMIDVLAINENAESAAVELFVARLRKMRPQNASYVLYAKALWPLFDACGPERPRDFGNPYTREKAEQEQMERRLTQG